MGKLININSGKFGKGTSSLILSIIAIMFSFTSLGEKTIGQEILSHRNKISSYDYFSDYICYCNVYWAYIQRKLWCKDWKKYIYIFYYFNGNIIYN
jgi:hypothetical protein